MSNAPQPASQLPTGSGAAQKPISSKPAAPAIRPPLVQKPADDGRGRIRRSIYAILITIATGAMMGRVLAVNSVDRIGLDKQIIAQAVAAQQQELKAAGRWHNQSDEELERLTKPIWEPQLAERPFLSANDRSRWLAMRALVEKGTYAIEDYVTDPSEYPNWDCIDTVMHQDSAGAPHMYSSKPPLLATLYAGPYWAACKIGSAMAGKPVTVGTNPYEIGRSLVVLLNVLPLVIYFLVLAGIVEQFGKTDWGRIFVMAAGTLGTFLTTYAVSLNNHLPAAVCAAITLQIALTIWYRDDRRWWRFALCGFFAALTAGCELPATSLWALVTAGLLWIAPRQTLAAYIPAALIVVAGFFATNWLAHASLVPPYGHRIHEETAAATTAAPADATSATATPAAQRATSPASDAFAGTIKLPSGKTAALRGHAANWYDYEFTSADGKLVESYWRNPKGIDAGEPAIGKYALHVLIGHHGIFSLTPLWLLAIPGLLLLWFGKDYRLQAASLSIFLISAVCIAFYLTRPLAERNYAGMSSGFRWIFWLTPLWLLAVLPTADKLAANRFGRAVACLLLGLSVLAASYPVWNPWTSPYLQNFWIYMGW